MLGRGLVFDSSRLIRVRGSVAGAEVTSTADEAASLDPLSESAVMFDVLAVYLAFSQRGLMVMTLGVDFMADGSTGLAAADAGREMLPTGCDVTRARVLPDSERAAGVPLVRSAHKLPLLSTAL